MIYSKAHYRMLADLAYYDTPEAEADRKLLQEILTQVRNEVHAAYPVVTTKNFEAADALRERRFKELSLARRGI